MLATESGVSLTLNGTSIAANSYVDVDDIGEGDDALLCHTDRFNCCTSPNTAGQWYFPNRSIVKIEGLSPPENVFFRNRGQSVVRLNRRGNPSERGLFRCEVPTNIGDILQNIYVNIGMLMQQCLLCSV